MPHVGEPCSSAVIDIGFTPHDFRDHGQATDERGEEIGDADTEHISVHVRFSFPGIDRVDSFGAED